VLREIDSQLRREWPYRRIMLEPLQVDGVDAFTETGVVVLARSRTRAGEQWKVGREFNRRLKNRFDELGIEFPVPQQTVHVVEQLKEPVRRSFTRPEVVRAEARGGEA
jgi:moderate conductance mechanosensitive channel